jgi:hypothetical protein
MPFAKGLLVSNQTETRNIHTLLHSLLSGNSNAVGNAVLCGRAVNYGLFVFDLASMALVLLDEDSHEILDSILIDTAFHNTYSPGLQFGGVGPNKFLAP